MTPHRTPFFLPLLYPSLTWRIPTNKKELYLTFDDGPVPGPTEFVLEQLNKFSAQATFFCIGDNIHKHPNIFKSILAHSHTVGNHTHNHLNGWKTKHDAYIENVNLFEKTSGYITTLFRPPYGRITRAQIKSLQHYKIIMWDVLSVDYDKNLSAEKCLRNTINAVRSGSIIVFHDSVKAERNMTYALPRLLDHFSDKGFTFKSLAQ